MPKYRGSNLCELKKKCSDKKASTCTKHKNKRKKLDTGNESWQCLLGQKQNCFLLVFLRNQIFMFEMHLLDHKIHQPRSSRHRFMKKCHKISTNRSNLLKKHILYQKTNKNMIKKYPRLKIWLKVCMQVSLKVLNFQCKLSLQLLKVYTDSLLFRLKEIFQTESLHWKFETCIASWNLQWNLHANFQSNFQ